jgi:hypothetical protein
MLSGEIVSCYNDTAELVLFHDVQMKGILAGGSFIRCRTKQMNRRPHCGIDRSWRVQTQFVE